MPKFEYEIIKRIELCTTVVVTAKDEDAADAKIDKRIADGKLDAKITYTIPKGWDVATDEMDKQLR